MYSPCNTHVHVIIKNIFLFFSSNHIRIGSSGMSLTVRPRCSCWPCWPCGDARVMQLELALAAFREAVAVLHPPPRTHCRSGHTTQSYQAFGQQDRSICRFGHRMNHEYTDLLTVSIEPYNFPDKELHYLELGTRAAEMVLRRH